MGFSQVKLALMSGVIGAAFMNAAGAQALKSGEQVHKEVCGVCHTAGVAKAPKLGDKKAWEPLISEGQAVLTAHGWVGVRSMPAKGGKADLPLQEFARATAFMARAAGGNWQDPDANMMESVREEEKERIADLPKKK